MVQPPDEAARDEEALTMRRKGTGLAGGLRRPHPGTGHDGRSPRPGRAAADGVLGRRAHTGCPGSTGRDAGGLRTELWRLGERPHRDSAGRRIQGAGRWGTRSAARPADHLLNRESLRKDPGQGDRRLRGTGERRRTHPNAEPELRRPTSVSATDPDTDHHSNTAAKSSATDTGRPKRIQPLANRVDSQG